MVRSKLKNRLNKEKSLSAKLAYKTQRNLCTSLLKKVKRDFYGKLNPSDISDNKKFWKIVKPFFSEKVISTENISIVENNVLLTDDKNVADIFNSFFSNAVENLSIAENDMLSNVVNEPDPILNAIKKYENHESIVNINAKFIDNTFSFSPTEPQTVLNEIYSLGNKKASPKESIPPHVIRDNLDIFVPRVTSDFNHSIASGIFPSNLKNANISPVFKKGNHSDKTNYRPVSLLPALSKIFERLLFTQINHYMDSKLSMHLCGFRKNLSAQNCLLAMLEKWRYCLDNKGSCGVILTDLSKAFDCLIHDLMIAKLNAYGFDYNSLKLIHNYLTGRLQRVRINSSYSSWSEIIYGVPQGSIIGPLLFNIYLNDLFMVCENSNIANYADDNSPYACERDTASVILQLENDTNSLLQWVANNGLKANPDKFHLILNETCSNHFIKIENFIIHNNEHKRLLGITIDGKLSFDEHVAGLCSKASQKLHALSRISVFMNTIQRQTIMKAFIQSQFGYCPLVWMFHSRKLNNRINKIHERSLRIAFDDNESSFQELLDKDNSVTVHARNIQTLAIELFKAINGFSPEIMSLVFPLKENINYCSKQKFKTRNIHTVKYGTETLAHLGPKIWALVPESIKNTKSLNDFKTKIKKWKPVRCPCNLCRTYVYGVGYVY